MPVPVFLFLTCFCFGLNNFAQEQYQATHWEVKDGLIYNASNSILKDKYGFIWFATVQGLSRFDGKQFINYNQSSEFGLNEDSLHNIWIGSSNGISRFEINTDSFSVINSPSVAESSSGFIIPFWSTTDEVFCVEKASQVTAYNIHTLKKRIALNKFTILQGTNGDDFFRFHFSILDPKKTSVWMLDRGGLTEIIFSTGKQQYYPLPCCNNVKEHPHDTPGMCYDKNRNVIWLNTNEGLAKFDLSTKQFTSVAFQNDFIEKNNQGSYPGISIDNRGRVWFATVPPNGILIYDPVDSSVIKSFPDPDLQEKVSEDNMCLYCDREGTVWTGKWSRKGIYQVNPLSQTAYRYVNHKTNPYSLSNDVINSLVQGPGGTIWIGTDDGLNIFDPATSVFKVFRRKDIPGLISNEINILAVDTAVQKAWIICTPPNRLFQIDVNSMKAKEMMLKDISGKTIQLSNYENISSVSYKHGCIISIRGRGVFVMNGTDLTAREIISYSNEFVTAIATDKDHFLFTKLYGTGSSRTYLNENYTWKQVSTPLDTLNWYRIYFDNSDQTYWIGGKGWIIHYDKNFRPIPFPWAKDDDKKGILGIIKDNEGNLWFDNSYGEIIVFNKKIGKFITLEEKDGYTKQLFGFNNPQAKDANGDLYFAGDNGLDRISPSRLSKQFQPSYVHLHSLTVNGNYFSLSDIGNNPLELSLKYFQNRINIETGNIDFYSKGKSRIRYKLEGLNNDWQYGPDYYTIRYDGLAPRKYKLVIQASNVVDDFNGPEKILIINISPPFWQTTWFRLLAGFILAALLFAIYRWRTATLRKQKRKLEQTVKERTSELVLEKAEVEKQKAKSDELLLNILPSEVAEELKEKGYTTAKSFDEVTVLFSDIKGFTDVAEKMTAQELVKEINTYFSAFDGIIQKYGLEKIKTIGDAYIAAGGLPEKNSATAQNVVEAAIAMQQTAEKLKQERVSLNKPHFELRIGIHTGPVVAGVVGIKKFQYDIWGDTVNLAARMEQSGVPGKINISQHTYEVVKGQFTCIHRGKIEAKNKGEIDMYFVQEEK